MKNSALKTLIAYIKPYKKAIYFSFVLSLITVFLTLIGPILIGKAIDEMSLGETNFYKAGIFIIGLLISFTLSSILLKVLATVTNKISYNTVRNIRKDAFSAIVDSPSSFSDSQNHGIIVSKIVNDADTVSEGLIIGVVQLFSGVITALATLIIMFVINAYIAAVVLILTPLSLVTAAFTTKKAYKLMIEQTQAQGELYSQVSESISGIKTIKSFGATDFENHKFIKINDNLYAKAWRAQYIAASINPITRFINALVFSAVCVLGAFFAVSSTNAITIGTLSIFLNYANQYTKPFNEVSEVLTHMSTALTSADRVFKVANVAPENKGGSEHILSTNGDFEIRNLNFSYEKDKPLIENFNLNVKSGQKIAIVGPTGCGKTTIINLLMQFYSADSGQIIMDGKDIKNYDLQSFRKLFGMVLQETVIFNDTVFNNIAYGKENATQEEVETAAKAAYANYFIENLKDGYNTVLDNSISISAGEKQLISIARIMLASPQVLILDEATSNVDILTEKYIQKAFKKMMENKTSFIVAHRLSTITDADIIIVMDKGKIIEQGSHAKLLENKGFYHELFTGNFS